MKTIKNVLSYFRRPEKPADVPSVSGGVKIPCPNAVAPIPGNMSVGHDPTDMSPNPNPDPDSPHHHHPPPHGPHHPPPVFRRISRYPEQVVGVLGRLLDRAGDFGDLDKLTQHLTNREPGDLKYLAPAVAELEAAGKDTSPKNILCVMVANKAIEYYERDKQRVLHGLKGNGSQTSEEGAQHAAILPIPPHDFHLLEHITPGKLYVLPDHHVPHELEDWEVAALPTRSRTIKAELAGVQSITFEGFIQNDGSVLTRSIIADLLADLADAGVKPLLRIVEMPHRPHHEKFVAIEDGYQTENCN